MKIIDGGDGDGVVRVGGYQVERRNADNLPTSNKTLEIFIL